MVDISIVGRFINEISQPAAAARASVAELEATTAKAAGTGRIMADSMGRLRDENGRVVTTTRAVADGLKATDAAAQGASKSTAAHAEASAKATGASNGLIASLSGAVKGFAALAAVTAVTKFAQDSVKAFEETGKAALKTQRTIGGTVEDASRLNYAFSQVGMDADTSASLLGKMSKTMESAKGSTATLGVAIKDASGHTRAMSEILPEVADKFAKMPNGPEKTAAAMALFGKQGQAMLPFLNKGKQGIQELMAASDKFGTTVGKDQVAAIAAATKNQRDWEASLKGLQIQVGAYLLPIMTGGVILLRDYLIPVLRWVTAAVGSVAGAINDWLHTSGVWDWIVGAFNRVKDGAQGLYDLIVKGDFTGAFADAFNVDEDSPIVAKILGIRDAVLKVPGYFQTARDAVEVFWGWFTGQGSDKTESGWLTSVGEAGALIGDKWQEVVDWFTGTAMPALTGFAATLRDGWGQLVGWVTGTFLPAFIGAVQGLWQRIQPLIPQLVAIGGQIIDVLRSAWDAITGAARVAFTVLGAIILGAVTAIRWIWQTFGDNILNILSIALQTVISVASGVFTTLKGVFDFFAALFRGDWSGMWEAVKEIFAGIWQSLSAIMSGAWGILVEIVRGGAAWVWSLIVKMKDDILGDFAELRDGASARISALVEGVVGFFKGLPDRISGMLSGAGRAIWDNFARPAIDAVNAVIEAFNNLPGPDLPLISVDSPFGGVSTQQSYNRNVPIGDTARSVGGLGIGNTLAAYRAMGAGLGVTNIWTGGGGRGYGSGDHQAGRALDLVGPLGRMESFIGRAQRAGDYAEMHGSGASRHVHYVPRNAYGDTVGSVALVRGGMGDTTTSMAGGGVYVAPGAVQVAGVSDPMLAARLAVDMLKREVTNARERA